MPSRVAWVTAAVVLLIALVIGVTLGWGGGLTFLFFASLAAFGAFAAGLGGTWMRDVSHGRFRDHGERNR